MRASLLRAAQYFVDQGYTVIIEKIDGHWYISKTIKRN